MAGRVRGVLVFAVQPADGETAPVLHGDLHLRVLPLLKCGIGNLPLAVEAQEPGHGRQVGQQHKQ